MFSPAIDHGLLPDRRYHSTSNHSSQTSGFYESVNVRLTVKPGRSTNLTPAHLHHSQPSKLLAIKGHKVSSRAESAPPQTPEEDKLEEVPGGYANLLARLAEIHKDTLHAPYFLKTSPEVFATFCQSGGSDAFLDKIRYQWDEPSQTITVLPLPSPGHESVSHFVDNIFPELLAFISEHTSGESKLVKAGTSAHELEFPDGKAGEKGFDIGLELNNPPPAYPPIVFEVGASESYMDLKRDAWDWLWGSCCQVQVVILVKLNKPRKGSMGEFEIANWGPAYAEVWERVEEEQKSVGDVEGTESLSSVAACFSRTEYEEVIQRRGERSSISLTDPPQSDHLTLYIKDFLVPGVNSASIKHGSDDAKLQVQLSELPAALQYKLMQQELGNQLRSSYRKRKNRSQSPGDTSQKDQRKMSRFGSSTSGRKK